MLYGAGEVLQDERVYEDGGVLGEERVSSQQQNTDEFYNADDYQSNQFQQSL